MPPAPVLTSQVRPLRIPARPWGSSAWFWLSSCGPVGAIVSYLGWSKSKAAGFSNTVGLIGLIWGCLGTVIGIIYMIIKLAASS